MWRSVTTGANLSMDHRSAVFDKAASVPSETKELRPLWLGDHYPLVDQPDESQWSGWQFDSPIWAGFMILPPTEVQVFHTGVRPMFDPAAIYHVTFADTGRNGP